MRILITNDDGIESKGLLSLHRRLKKDHEVWIVAPERDRSGSSHAITLQGPTRVHKWEDRVYACNGTPADCVLLACLGLIPNEIDLVISGINHGPNLGTDIIYSGTVAAARQGVLMGKTSIAASICSYSSPYYLESPIEFISRNIDLLVSLSSEEHFLNINFPNRAVERTDIAVTFPEKRIYKDELVTFQAPDGELYCFLDGSKPESPMEEGSDSFAIDNGQISLSPILIHPINHRIEEVYRKAKFWVGAGSI